MLYYWRQWLQIKNNIYIFLLLSGLIDKFIFMYSYVLFTVIQISNP